MKITLLLSSLSLAICLSAFGQQGSYVPYISGSQLPTIGQSVTYTVTWKNGFGYPVTPDPPIYFNWSADKGSVFDATPTSCRVVWESSGSGVLTFVYNTSGYDYSNTYNVTIRSCPTLTAGSVAENQTICPNSDVAAFTVTSSPTGGTGFFYSYQWQMRPPGGTWSDISNATSATYDHGTLATAQEFRRKVSSCTQVAYTLPILVSMQPAPNTANAGPDQADATTCDLTSVTLAGNTPVNGTGQWSHPTIFEDDTSFGDVSSPTSTFSGTAGSSYIVKWTITGACTSSEDYVLIKFNTQPTPAAAGNDQVDYLTCGHTSVTLAGNTPSNSTGTWNVVSGSGGSLSASSSPTSAFTGSAGSTYTLRWTITNICGSSSDDMTVKLNKYPTTANAGPDQTGAATCGLTQVTLAGNSPSVGTGSWSVVSGTGGSFGNASSPSSTFSGTLGSTYVLRWTIANSPCTSSYDEVTIKFNNPPTTANAGVDQTGASTCGLTSVTLGANAPSIGTGNWSVVSGSGGSFSNPSSPTSTFTGSPGSTYALRWSITNICGPSSDEMTVKFNKFPTAANAGPDQTGASTCGLTQVTLGGNNPTAGAGSWSVVSGTGGSFGSASSATSTFSGTSGSTYVLRWTIASSPCSSSSDDVTIKFNSSPIVNAGSDQTGASTCGLTSVTLQGNTPAVGSGSWSVVGGSGGSFGNSSSAGSSFTGSGGSTYVLRWTISNGLCASSDDVNVKFNILSAGGTPAPNPETCGTGSGQITLSGHVGTVQKWQARTGAGSWTDISNTSINLTYSNVTATTTYRAEVKNGACPAVTSAEAVVTVYPIPTLSAEGQTQLAPGGSVLLVTEAGVGPYEWFKDNQLINGESANQLIVSKPGKYKVKVRPNLGSQTCITAELVVSRSLDAQWLDMNYIKTTQFAIAGISTETDLYDLAASDLSQSIVYFDGLGRSLQSISIGSSPGGNDIVQPNAYDLVGREAVKYLPYGTEARDGRYQPDAIVDQGNFYENPPAAIQASPAPFSVTIFEESPLNRILKQGAPGEDWQPNGDPYSLADRTLHRRDETNTAATEVLDWKYDAATHTVDAKDGSNLRNFPTNVLKANKTYDEHGKLVIEYVDKLGRTLLKRVQAGSVQTPINDTNFASTYYIYDEFGNLVTVLPPQAVKTLGGTTYHDADIPNRNKFLLRWAFRYKYDGRRRMIEKQLPGASPVYMIYDDRDRLVLTQDGVQRTAKRWTFTKYDAFNRPVMTGIITADSTLAQDKMQRRVDQYYNDLASNGGAWFETFTTNATNIHGYTNNSYPRESAPGNYLTVTYYDDYRFRNLLLDDYPYVDENLTAQEGDQVYEQPDAEHTQVRGQVTGAKLKVLNGGATGYSWLNTVNYYDDRYRMVQSVSDNYRGGMTRTSTVYDFVGRVLKSRTVNERCILHWDDMVAMGPNGDGLSGNSTGWGSCGAASVEMLGTGADGWIEFSPTVANRHLVVGFSTSNQNAHWNTIKYQLYLVNNGTIQIREGASSTNYLGGGYTYKSGDVFRIERKQGQINYYQNGKLLLTRAGVNDAFLADIAFGSGLTEIAGIRASFGAFSSYKANQRMVYDHAGRLLRVYHNTTDDPVKEVLLSANEYNELGQLIRKRLHSTDDTNFKQDVDYRYNIRGWLTRINNSDLSPDDQTEPPDYFGIELGYQNDLGIGGTDPLYDGNISAAKWSNSLGISEIKERAYNFSYDAMNRLSGAMQKTNVAGWNATNDYQESNITYDANGNIKSLYRTGNAGAVIDNLSYPNYDGNKVLRITDSGDVNQGFVDGHNTSNDYEYDNNGNLVFDRNKGGTELLENGEFENGNASWTVADAEGRFTFANNEVQITAGGAASTLKQAVIEKGKPYVVTVDIELGAGSLEFYLGGSLRGTITATGKSVLSLTASSSNTDFLISAGAAFVGKIKSVSVTGLTVIAYNFLNLPESVSRSTAGRLRYIYNAAGTKLAQVLLENDILKKITEYDGEFIYENDTLKFINDGEGRVVMTGDEPEYQYHMKDHLGNVRLTFTTKDKVDSNSASLEASSEAIERTEFLRYDEARTVRTLLFDHTHLSTNVPLPEYDNGFAQNFVPFEGDGTINLTLDNGRLKAGGASQWNNAYMFVNTTAGHRYKVSFDIDLAGAGSVEAFAHDLSVSQNLVQLHIASNGSYSYEFNAASSSTELLFGNNVAGPRDFFLDNLKIENLSDGGLVSQRLNGSANEIYGLAKSLSVMPGDVIKAEVFAKYVDPQSSNWTQTLTSLMSAIATNSGGIVVDGGGYSTSTASFSFVGAVNTSGSSNMAPKAFLNWIVFDRDYVFKNGGYIQISEAAKENGSDVPHERLAKDNIAIKEPGYVYIYLSNENGTPVDVFFDDFSVEQMESPVVRMDDYYPFGLTFDSYRRENAMAQNYLYNGKEKQDELNLDWMDHGFRMYSPEISRWMNVDKMADAYYSFSPFNFGLNNPISNADGNGMWTVSRHYRMTMDALSDVGLGKKQADLIAHYASVFADNPGSNIELNNLVHPSNKMHYRYDQGIEYYPTENSQVTDYEGVGWNWNIWHSMRSPWEKEQYDKGLPGGISADNAMLRGMGFGWNMIFHAAFIGTQLSDMEQNSESIQNLGQGLHALQDAYAHRGSHEVDAMHLINDKFGSTSEAEDITSSAIFVFSVMTGDKKAVENMLDNGIKSVNLTGASGSDIVGLAEKLKEQGRDLQYNWETKQYDIK